MLAVLFNIYTLISKQCLERAFSHFKKGGAELGKTETNRAKQFWIVLATNEIRLIVPGSI